MSETETLTAARVPTVYFIDDSATMREVIKIAFRKENIHVVTCPDAATAIAQFGETAPDAVITDVIMPDKDGYEVCQFIKQHEQLGRTPVILMSGVVNRAVAEKAMAVKADELIRKPFQPQDLIARVKNLLNPRSAGVSAVDASARRIARSVARFFAGFVRLVLGRSRALGSFQPCPCSSASGERACRRGTEAEHASASRCSCASSGSASCTDGCRADRSSRIGARISGCSKAAQ